MLTLGASLKEGRVAVERCAELLSPILRVLNVKVTLRKAPNNLSMLHSQLVSS
jgi:hypothetical protein